MIEAKINAVSRTYRQLDRHVSAFKRQSGMGCAIGCGACCLRKDMQATVLELLPAVYELYLLGQEETMAQKLEDSTDTQCAFFNPLTPGLNCTVYPNRPLVCRLFGFAVNEDKNGGYRLVTCNILKQSMQTPLAPAVLAKAPNASSYHMRLYGLDPMLSKPVPFNQAILQAIEHLQFHFRFRKRPA